MIQRWTPDYCDFGDGRCCTPPVARPVGLRHYCHVDLNRADVDGRPRRVMVSVFYPAEAAGSRARLVDILAPERNRALEILYPDTATQSSKPTRDGLCTLSLHAWRDTTARIPKGGAPLLIYYPAGEATRLSNAAVCEHLAACGYIVAAMDAPRDAPVVVYPDGEIARPPMADDESCITPRVTDVRGILDDLMDPGFKDLGAGAIDSERVGMFGNSRGGYLSNICAVEDSRIRAAVNMDGFLWGFWGPGTGLDHFSVAFQARARALQTPILRLCADMNSRNAAAQKFYSERDDFGGPFSLVALNGFTHGSFGTTSYLNARADAALAALDLPEPPPFGATIAIVDLLSAFFDAALSEPRASFEANWPPIDGYMFALP